VIEDLRDVTFRPIDTWLGTLTPQRRHATFTASWRATRALFERELRALGARRVVVQLALAEADFRIDGLPRANARAEHPGVIVSFESRYGPLRYAVDTFTTWQDNVRAIALALEALRKVDRYGVTKRGEQYTGWRALPQHADGGIETAEQARAFLDEHGGTFVEAAKRLHPDRGGDAGLFAKAVRARELLGGAA
jgi:hypothetical protein